MESVPLPIVDVKVITPNGLRTIAHADVSPGVVGWKAFGLSTLPAEWVPSFFVISGDCFAASVGQRELEMILAAVHDCIRTAGWREHTTVFIRSSGVAETLQVRGQLESLECAAKDIWKTACDLYGRLLHGSSGHAGAVHFVVQRSVVLLEKGHLSNERRLSREPRDWVAEFEPVSGEPGRTEPVAVRTWRSGKTVETQQALLCEARTAIGIVLKRVGGWAMQFSIRMHFEWVWDKSAIWLVQADNATSGEGVDPRSVIPTHIPRIAADNLYAFRRAQEADFATYGKLRNARLYAELGYRMPPFYILHEPVFIRAILSGNIVDELAADLVVLTQRPFIIRTDGIRIPSAKREMLPRSDELRSAEDAKRWLLGDFAAFVETSGLIDAGLCLIAHHFIPSVASAWARAEPGNPIVRIESLWGIPEGLYWHSHDTFEVDTGSRTVSVSDIGGKNSYQLRERLRYKGTFIAPDAEGRWVPQSTDAAHDWARSITRQQWIFEIARTTRLIAERTRTATSVMWFVDNHPEATSHRVLPWFHSPSPLESGPKAAPRRKRLTSHDFVIRHVADWEQLKLAVGTGQSVERVVMAPVDTELIRNAGFAAELAALATEHGFVVELSGGILSHAYYMLSRGGCRVECVDLFGIGEEVVEFHKLVRDGIPQMIKERGERVESVPLKGDALVRALRQKLVEEAFEALDASSGDELLGELADLSEVLLGLCSALNISSDILEGERLKKRKKRGGFEKGLMLLKTATPQSIANSGDDGRTVGEELSMSDLAEDERPAISDPMALPSRSQYRRPDLRNVDGGVEKLFTFKTDVVSLHELQQRLSFEMPLPQGGQLPLVLTVELDRGKAVVRGKIRLQVRQTQLELF